MEILLNIINFISSLYYGLVLPFGLILIPSSLVFTLVMKFLKKPDFKLGLIIAKNTAIGLVLVYILEWIVRILIGFIK
jgi:preprotein translocase subunit Sss1